MRRTSPMGICIALLLLLAPVLVEAQGTGTIRGRLADTTGAPVSQATVTVDGTALRAISDEPGEFTITAVPTGAATLIVRRLGYAVDPFPVVVRAGDVARADITLTPLAVGLSAVQVVVGSRARHTAAEELAVPVDVFTPEEMRSTGTTETAAVLAQLAPSVNFPRQSVSDASEIVRPFTMRGLSPDHTLVLLNGRRRHRTALVHYFGAGMGAGASGVDMNTIPVTAVERLEVLRDGAAAQYGSDAIAGVVNLVLRSGAIAPTLTVEGGFYNTADFPDDGTTYDIGAAWGIPIGRGSIGLFAEYRDRDPTNRAGADIEDQVVPGDADVIGPDGKVIQKRNPVPQPNHHWGDGAEESLMLFTNANLPLGEAGSTTAYAFGGWSMREGTGFGYYRQAMSARNWPQRYPIGFLPTFAPDVLDVSAAGGVRGLAGATSWDLGLSVGHNAFEFNLENTLNTSLGPCFDVACAPGPDLVLGTADDPGIPNQSSFMAGRLKLTEAVLSLDVGREMSLGLPSPVNVALGAAYRRENYQVIAGEPASYLQGWHPDQYGEIAPAGSQVFPGLRPSDEADADRDNLAAYIDLESTLVPGFLANVAGRYEHYSDFGSEVTGKVAVRVQPSAEITLRAAASTGFRAPSLNQRFYSATATTFEADPVTGAPRAVDFGIFPVASREARALSARELEAETSRNFSAGFALSPTPNFNLTADYYHIDVDDRILLTTVLATDSVASILRNVGSAAEAAQYFTNALSTRTNGVDVTANYRLLVGLLGALDVTGTFNYTENEIVGDIPLPPELEGTGAVLFDEFGEGGLLALEKERPLWRGALTTEYTRGAWRAMGRASFYGPFQSALYGYCASCVQEYPAKTIFDLELGLNATRDVTLTLGARNLFDEYPGRMRDENSFGLFLYPSASPFGFNGRFVYARAAMTLGR